MIILVSGSGLVIGKMVCLKSGVVLLSTTEAKDCCKDESGKTEFKGQCCDLNNLTFQHHQFVSQNQVQIKCSQISSPILYQELLFSVPKFSNSKFKSTKYQDPPDLLSANSQLSLLGTFRI